MLDGAIILTLLLTGLQASPLNGTWELTRIFRSGPVPSTRAVPIDSTVYLRITLRLTWATGFQAVCTAVIGASPTAAKSKPAHSAGKAGSLSGSRSRNR